MSLGPQFEECPAGCLGLQKRLVPPEPPEDSGLRGPPEPVGGSSGGWVWIPRCLPGAWGAFRP